MAFELDKKCLEVVFLLANLVSKDLQLLVITLYLVLFMHHLYELLLYQLSLDVIHSLSYSHVEVLNLVEEECLEQLHLPLNIPQLTLVDLLEDAQKGVFNDSDGLLLHTDDLSPDDSLELLESLLVHDFAL